LAVVSPNVGLHRLAQRRGYPQLNQAQRIRAHIPGQHVLRQLASRLEPFDPIERPAIGRVLWPPAPTLGRPLAIQQPAQIIARLALAEQVHRPGQLGQLSPRLSWQRREPIARLPGLLARQIGS
jgi:hypothetical protein